MAEGNLHTYAKIHKAHNRKGVNIFVMVVLGLCWGLRIVMLTTCQEKMCNMTTLSNILSEFLNQTVCYVWL